MAIEQHYTVKEVSALMKTPEKTIRSMIGKTLTAAKFGRSWKIPASVLKKHLESRTLKAN